VISCRRLLLTAPAALRLRAVPLTNSELVSPSDATLFVIVMQCHSVTLGHYSQVCFP
jgi:hypothetical protein